MFSYIWPMALIIVANTVYQICTKSTPEDMNPFASLTVTYLVGAAVSFILFFILGKNGNFIAELKKMNWTSVALGLVIVALEGGWIYAYKNGWQVSSGQIVQCAILGIILIFVGLLVYKETLTWNKLVGIAICLVGLVFINLK